MIFCLKSLEILYFLRKIYTQIKLCIPNQRILSLTLKLGTKYQTSQVLRKETKSKPEYIYQGLDYV